MSQHLWIAFCVSLLGGVTFLYRYSFISSKGKMIAQKVSPNFLALLGPATFTAIVINNLMASQNQSDFQLKILVLSLSSVIAYFTKSIMLTLIFGLLLLFCLQHYWVAL